MKLNLVLLIAFVAFIASFANLVSETLDYGFPDDLVKADDNTTVGDSSENITWFVHVTDLHISKFYVPERTSKFLELVSELLKHVEPSVVVVTGDLTDAKTPDYSGSRQYREEWEDYNKAVTLAKSRNKTVWLDIRGNHDNFDVPHLQHEQNYFKEYSSQGKEGNLQSYLKIVEHNKVRIGFLAVDSTLKPGPRRPFNFVGALNRAELDHLSKLAKKSEAEADATVWFGHYPTSTIVSPQPGLRSLMSSGLVYLCGHLHNLHGLAYRMVVRHKTGLREAELTDWKDNRFYRIMALDNGILSFKDIDYDAKPWPVVLVTWPPRSEYTAGDREPLYKLISSTHVRLLVFSQNKIMSVHISIDDSDKMKCQSKNENLYTVKWNPKLYAKGTHKILVYVEDDFGSIHVEEHSFSLDGSQIKLPFIGQFILLVDLIAFFQFSFAALVFVCVVPLTLCRVSFPLPVIGKSFQLISSISLFYYPLVLSPLYLTIGPWFIGEVLTNSVGVVFCWGTFVYGSYLPTATTWLYGTYHLITAHLPLLIALAINLNTRLSDANTLSPKYPVYSFIKRNGLMLLIVLKQAWLVQSFYLAYGIWAVILGPFRTGYLVMSCILWTLACNIDEKTLVKYGSHKYQKHF